MAVQQPEPRAQPLHMGHRLPAAVLACAVLMAVVLVVRLAPAPAAAPGVRAWLLAERGQAAAQPPAAVR